MALPTFDEFEFLGFPITISHFDMLETRFRGEIFASDLINNVGKKVRMVGRLVTIKYVKTVKKELMHFGLELTFEQFLKRGLYYLFTTSVYDSKYKGSDGIERNTVFNGNFILNGLVGKEWELNKPGKTYKRQSSIFFDIKSVWAGGRRYTPINKEKSMEEGKAVYDTDHAYGEQYKNYFRTDFKIGFRQSSKRSSMEWLIDFQNIFNTQNIYGQKYNTQTGEVNYTYQMGILVIPQWRIMF